MCRYALVGMAQRQQIIKRRLKCQRQFRVRSVMVQERGLSSQTLEAPLLLGKRFLVMDVEASGG